MSEIKKLHDQIARLDNLLEARAAVYPVRDDSYQLLQKEIELFTHDLLSALPEASPDSLAWHHGADLQLAQHPVFICGAMKSGTTLVSRLLDGHPALLVVPGDTHFAQQRNDWDTLPFEQFACIWMKRLINPSGQKPFWFLGRDPMVLRNFLSTMRHYRLDNRYDSFQALILAMHATLRPPAQPASMWVEKTPENERFALELAERFPEARFIHILRNPLHNLGALKMLSEYRGKPFSTRKRAKTLKKLNALAKSNQARLGEHRYRIIQYEDLVDEPDRVLHEMAAFLRIEDLGCLRVPTENGQPATANSMYPDSRVRGRILGHASDARYLKTFSRAEVKDILGTFRNSSAKLGFHWQLGKPAPTRPWKWF